MHKLHLILIALSSIGLLGIWIVGGFILKLIGIAAIVYMIVKLKEVIR